MEITVIQAIIIFWSSIVVWVLVEYLFYRMQHNGSVSNGLEKHFNHHENRPIH
ncbi:MAG: hypothetical protein PF637_10690 [Spirochaetes bacterium]|jgi:hypothetical protein|nr:hypothetical protein [Spirochaetota bacterium]